MTGPRPTPDTGSASDEGSRAGKGVSAEPEAIRRFANHKVQGWADDAKSAHTKVTKTQMHEYSFSDTEGGRLYGSVYAAAQRTYKDVLHRAHRDIEDTKKALLESAKLMDEQDDQAKARLAQLEHKWSAENAFESTGISDETARKNRKVVTDRTQAATEAGVDIADPGTGEDTSGTGGEPETREDEDGNKRYKGAR